ncbi:MAG TPA: 50S ribosomal protein L5 [Candidatus Saccharimonadales bacterium]|nr:50S ribosomal protein L5 [Candidatus Saccharimonadales bacterium]
MADLKKTYLTETKPKLQKDLHIKNPMAVPQMSKIVVNIGVRNAVGDKKGVPAVSDILGQITGQKPKVTKAKKSIAQFKLRQGDKIGVVVTMRGKRMYNFYDKLVNVVLPRIKDFHGVKKDSFDPKGNYTLGIIEYSVFPEIDTGKVDRIQGLEISIVTTARNKEEGQALLTALGMPFEK